MEKKETRSVIVLYDSETGKITAREIDRIADDLIIKRVGDDAEFIKKLGEDAGRFVTFQVDPLDPLAIEAAACATERMLGPIDIWINPPVNDHFSLYRTMDSGDTAKSTHDSYSVQVFGTLSALRRMLPRNQGRIIFITADAVFADDHYGERYLASKKAIEGFYKLIKSELLQEESNIKINSVSYPLPDTKNIDLMNNVCHFDPGEVRPIETAKLAVQGIKYILENGRVEIL